VGVLIYSSWSATRHQLAARPCCWQLQHRPDWLRYGCCWVSTRRLQPPSCSRETQNRLSVLQLVDGPTMFCVSLILINSPVYFSVPQHRIFVRCWMLVKTFMARLVVAPTATRIVLFFQQELGLQDVTRQLQSLYGKLTVAKCWTRPTKVWQHVDVTWFDLICNFLVFRMFASYFLGAGFCWRFTIIQPCFCCIRWCLHRSKLDRALPSSQHLPTLWVQNPVADNRAGRCSCNQFLVLWDKWM